jgi:short-subunit dehydrogenase
MASAISPSIPALVTGASSGLGEEFARQLAARGHDVTLVARREHRLEALASELRAAHRRRIHVVIADLETARGRGTVARLLEERSPWLLVNNAGFGSHGPVAELDQRRELGEVQLNAVGVHQLSLAALPGLLAKGAGGIINVASTAAFQPLPFMATYAATKAFVLAFTEALAEELHGTGARAMALCPGPVRTEFEAVAGVEDYFRLAGPMTVSAERCVATALRAFDGGSPVCIPGWANAGLMQVERLAPRAVVRKVAARIFQPDR